VSVGMLPFSMGLKPLQYLVKHIFPDNGLDATDYTNKFGRATLVIYMFERGVPREVGVHMTGYFNANSYSKYNTTQKAQTQAAQW
jgi:hypothetical protein